MGWSSSLPTTCPDVLLELESQEIYGIGERMEQRLNRAIAQLWEATPFQLRRVWGGINGVLSPEKPPIDFVGQPYQRMDAVEQGPAELRHGALVIAPGIDERGTIPMFSVILIRASRFSTKLDFPPITIMGQRF
jgi:hypothetical protein